MRDYSNEQQQAIASATAWFTNFNPRRPVFRLFGFAGTGKSTVADALVEALGLTEAEVMYLAPTGKAAKVLISKGCPASTVHGAFYQLVSSPDELWHVMNAELDELALLIKHKPTNRSQPVWKARIRNIKAELQNPKADDITFAFRGHSGIRSGARLLVVDEASMLADEHYTDLSGLGLPMILLGDPGQLPPVRNGLGTSLAMQNPDVTLIQVHRQANGSSILDIANLARNGDSIDFGDDGEGVSVRDGRGQRSIELVLRKARISDDQLLAFDQIICGLNKTRHAINELAKKRHGVSGVLPSGARGEKLIVTKNYELNGVTLPSGSTISVERDNRDRKFRIHGLEVPIGFPVKIMSIDGEFCDISAHSLWKAPFEDPLEKDLERRRREAIRARSVIHAEWGWAITVHKAQGSQWGKVLVIDESSAFREDKYKWLYTAVTRAAKELTIVRT